MGQALRTTTKRQEILVILLTIGMLGTLYFYNLGGWLIEDDEGSFLYQAWRVSEGDRPYADFFTSDWPLFPYTAGTLMDLLGRSIVAIRAVSVLLTLASALIVFLLARRFLPAEGAWLAMLTFLLHPQVFFYGRRLYPEPFMLFFVVLGLYLFDRGWDEQHDKLLIGAGLSFGLATLYKVLGFLPLVGCLLWAIIDARQQRTNWRSLITQAMVFSLPFGLLVGLSFLGFVHWEPAFYSSVIGVNLAQGQELGWTQILVKGVVFVLSYLFRYLPLMVFVLPAAWTSRRENRRWTLISWQLPTALAFLITLPGSLHAASVLSSSFISNSLRLSSGAASPMGRAFVFVCGNCWCYTPPLGTGGYNASYADRT